MVTDCGAGFGARVGLRRDNAAHPFTQVSPGDNIVAIRTAAYGDDPLWIRGPGAGSDVTALQLWSQVVAAAGTGNDDEKSARINY